MARVEHPIQGPDILKDLAVRSRSALANVLLDRKYGRLPNETDLSLVREYTPDRNEEIVMELFSIAAQQARSYGVPPDQIEETEAVIRHSFEDVRARQAKKPVTDGVFAIHRRDPPPELHAFGLSEDLIPLVDTQRAFPCLNPLAGVDPRLIEMIMAGMPPVEVGRIEGTHDGTDISCAIVVTAVSPHQQMHQRTTSDRKSFARDRIQYMTDLARDWGAPIVGLGATMAGLTTHGQDIEIDESVMALTTGHTMTVYGITEWAKHIADFYGFDLYDTPITLVGADGSIGRATSLLLATEGARELHLHDKRGREERLSKWAYELQKESTRNGGIKISTYTGMGRNGIDAACRNGRIGLGMASVPHPIISAKHLKHMYAYIDDSQPFTAAELASALAGTPIIWPLLQRPSGTTRSFKYGLLGDETDFTCANETLLLAFMSKRGQQFGYHPRGPVTADKVRVVREIAPQFGVALSVAQSFGHFVDLSTYNRKK